MSDHRFRMPDLEAPLRELKQQAFRKNNPAQYMRDRMMDLISAYERQIDADTEISAELVGSNVPPFHLRTIKASNPDILIFVGKDIDGKSVMLMQHHSQMSVFLSTMKKLEEKPYRIGFTAPRQE